MKQIYVIIIFAILSGSCARTAKDEKQVAEKNFTMASVHKPFARYWWFASEIKKEDIRYNLDWLKEKGFGGVELAWVYPLNAMDPGLDQGYTPRFSWLGSDWQDAVQYAMLYADSIGLGCDLTLGTLWPFGDTKVSYEQASQQYAKDERQVITKSWEYPDTGYVVDHLEADKYLEYFNRVLNSFPEAETGLPHSYFIDSWEVETRGLWYDDLQKDFIKAYGYDIAPLMDSLYEAGYEDSLYDYMKLISSGVTTFYHNFDSVLNSRGYISRGQCSGAPCDIISAYSELDIPEGEAMLYEPEYNLIPVSAATLSGKNIVSAETFTCLYGWPRDHIREEKIADLKLVADALFAVGVNHIVWHGRPHNPAGYDTVNFYASVHLGDSGALAPHLPAFNKYLQKVSSVMKKGKPYTDVAVYLPTEDAWMKGEMPEEMQFPWAWGHYEMRYVYFPEILKGHHPTWINGEFLEKSVLEDGKLKTGDAAFNYLYIESAYLDWVTLRRVYELAVQGLEITLEHIPEEPGTIKHPSYNDIAEKLARLPNVHSNFRPFRVPLVKGSEIPPYRARVVSDTLFMFFANPQADSLSYPLSYGQAGDKAEHALNIQVFFGGNKYDLDLSFRGNSSLLYRLSAGEKINVPVI